MSGLHRSLELFHASLLGTVVTDSFLYFDACNQYIALCGILPTVMWEDTTPLL